MSPDFDFAADLHLSNNAWVNRPMLCGDAYHAFAQIVSDSLLHSLPLLLGGDLFDRRRPEPDAVVCMTRQIERMAQANLPVIYIQGQHELADTPWLSIHPWATHVHKQAFTIAGYKGYGLDWLPVGELQEALQQIPPDTHFLLCHQVWTELMGVGRCDGSLAEIPHVSAVLTGDLHKHHVYGPYTGASGNQFRVFSPGSTCMRKIDEQPQKFYFRMGYYDAFTGCSTSAVSVPLASRPFVQVVIENSEHLDYFCGAVAADLQKLAASLAVQQLPEMLRKPILRVLYRDDLSEVYRRIRAAVGDTAFLFEQPVLTTQNVVVNANALPAGSCLTLRDAVTQLTATDPESQAGCLRLLDSPEPSAELDRMVEELLNVPTTCG